MIYLLRGVIAVKEIETVVVDVNGVGYGVTVPLSTYNNLGGAGEEIELRIHTVQRENSIELFGFVTDAEKKLFEKLLSVSGIGPKAAINVLSNISVTDLINSVAKGDLARRKIRGIGSKTAMKIVNELKDKLNDITKDLAISSPTPVLNDTISALLNLGYTNGEIDRVRSEIEEIAAISPSVEDSLRGCLKIIGRI